MSTTQYIVDASTRHQVFLQRYGAGQSKKAQKTLARLRREINARLMQEPTEFQRTRLEQMLKDIDALSVAAFAEIGATAKQGALDLIRGEADLSVALYSKATKADFTSPSDAALIQAVENSAMASPAGVGTITIDAAVADYGMKKAAQIKQTILDGIALGDTSKEIADKVGGMINNLQARQIDTLVRTITNHVSSIARQSVYDANMDILNGYKWLATLDSRTTLICASRDQEVYTVGAGPMPPAHWGCRSTTIPVVKDEYNLGASVTGKRASIDGPVSGATTYGGWLKKQPREFIDEALGPERASLFVSGKLTLDKFVDPTGRVYTLEQLRGMHPFVFQEI